MLSLGQRPWMLPLAAIFTFLLIRRLLNYIVYRRKIRLNGCLPAPTYPHADGPLGIGHLFKIARARRQNRLPEIFSSIFNDRSPDTHTIAHYMLGKKSYWTRDAENIKAILSSNFKDWGLPPARIAAFSSCWGGGIFGADGRAWEHSRAKLRPAFSRSQAEDVEVLKRHIQNLIMRIRDAGDNTVELSELFSAFAMDIGTDLLFGDSTGCLDPQKSEEGKQFASSFDYIMQQMSLQLSAPIFSHVPNKKLKESVKFIFDYADYFVDKATKLRHRDPEKASAAKEDPRRGYSFLSELTKVYDSPEELRGEVLSIMVAGRDTTASLLSIMFWHISRRDDILQKLRKEIDGLESQNPSAADLKNMKYLNQVINEVLRLYPINPINSRIARCDTILPRGGGPNGDAPLFIPKGQIVIFSSLALQRRKDVWGEDALELRPERWERMKPTTWNYIPFGGGARLCLGQKLALLEAGYTTVRLLQEFKDIEPVGKGPFSERFAMALSSGNGCKMKLR